jgi:hypothetical protein
MGVLEPQAKSKIFIQGDITLKIDGREAYTISLFNEDGIEPSNLKVGINKAETPSNSTSPPDQANGGASSRKRSQDAVNAHDDTDGSQKRRRIDSVEDRPESNGQLLGETGAKTREEAKDSNASIMTKLHSVSAQIKWVEECRRIADEAHDGILCLTSGKTMAEADCVFRP